MKYLSHAYNHSQSRKINAMTEQDRDLYLSTAKRVDVRMTTQYEDGNFVNKYVAVIRGILVGEDGKCQHDTPEAAMTYGKEVLAHWKEEYARKYGEGELTQ